MFPLFMSFASSSFSTMGVVTLSLEQMQKIFSHNEKQRIKRKHATGAILTHWTEDTFCLISEPNRCTITGTLKSPPASTVVS